MIGDNRDIVVRINHPVGEYTIEFIHQIEQEIDDAISSLGFARSTTNKTENGVELIYWQFARCYGD